MAFQQHPEKKRKTAVSFIAAATTSVGTHFLIICPFPNEMGLDPLPPPPLTKRVAFQWKRASDEETGPKLFLKLLSQK